MTAFVREHRILVVIVVVLLAGVAGTVVVVAALGTTSDGGPDAAPESPTPSPSESSEAPVVAAASGCPDKPTPTSVRSADELVGALADAAPGDVIVLSAGRYVGNFATVVSGTSTASITLCGPSDAILDGGDPEDGYVFHLDGASYWHLIGFTVTNGQKGVMADGTVGSVIEGLTVTHIGDEAIHLRRFSTDNTVMGNTISDTGLRKPKFGEGIYVGSAESNWCDVSGCQPDTSDRNIIDGNHISGTTSESIDVKEGTTGGIIRGNTFDGSSIVEADSWVDVKGNEWLVERNSGTNSPGDGFQTHEILDGWGTRNVFRDNVAVVNGPGFGFSLTPARDNVVTCGNTASSAGEGFSNVNCSG
ncbi:MAG: right-handed parallel beta-helix repeat-containing protein [Pseudolysinimonas sp.]